MKYSANDFWSIQVLKLAKMRGQIYGTVIIGLENSSQQKQTIKSQSGYFLNYSVFMEQ